jgi:ParB/RepB/Spo0J family partition protein
MNLESLAGSIDKLSLIHPISVTEPDKKGRYTLLCGERRLAAVKLLKHPTIKVNIIKNIDTDTMLLLELDENVQREKFSWQEIMSLKGRLFYSMLEKNPNLTQEEFSKSVLHQSTGLTSMELSLYDASGSDPSVIFIESMPKALEYIKQKRITELMKEKQERELAKQKDEKATDAPITVTEIVNEETQKTTKLPIYTPIIMNTAKELLESLQTHSVDGMVTDPQFGIEIQKVKGRIKGAEVYENEDTKEYYIDLMWNTFNELSRVLKPGANIYMLFSMENYKELLSILEEFKFNYWPHPLIWIKSLNSQILLPGACQAPDLYPGMSYHPILFARAPGKARTLFRMGQPNVFFEPGINPTEKTHPFEIPTAVYAELSTRSFRPGDTVIDPFCGSGNSIVSGLRQGYKMYGSEKVEMYRVWTQEKIVQQMKIFGDGIGG